MIVKQDEQKPIPVEVLAASIKAISDGITKLRAGPLNERALVLLIQHAAPSIGYGKYISPKHIKAVLEGISSLEREYLKPKAAAKK
mgnify:CR=1 FL=1